MIATNPAPPRPASRVYLVSAIAIVSLGLAWTYATTLAGLIEVWSQDDNYSHGFFVLPIVAAILWKRRDRLDRSGFEPSWWGILGLVGLLVTKAWLFEANQQWFEWATILPAAALAVLAVGGPGALGWAWPAIAFAAFLIPLPLRFNGAMAGPLQSLATLGSVNLLQASGLPVISEGNVIVVGGERLEVARACNGLSMLLSFACLIAALVVLVDRPVRERLALILSIIPIALFCNVLRIAVTAWATHLAGHAVESVHDWAGLAMMPVALALIWAELRLLSWVFFEVEVEPIGLVRPASPAIG